MKPALRSIRKLLRFGLIPAAGILAGAMQSHAQGTATIFGEVRDSSGIPVYGAELSVQGTQIRATSDENGFFRISDMHSGVLLLQVRRLGFLPVTLQLQITEGAPAGSPIQVRLTELSTVLKPIVVEAHQVKYSGRLAGYYERLEKKNGGYFIPREQIDRENPRTLVQLLQRVPGITPFRGRAGLMGVRLRGRTCWPFIWIDGIPMPAGEVDLEAFSPQTLHGIEIYSGATTAPARFIMGTDNNSCGTILLWSRGPDTDPITSTHHPTFDLQQLVATLTIYTLDEVDSAAAPAKPLEVQYPPALYASGIGGLVVAEFVVDTAGRMEPGSFGIVSSTNPLFSEAVKNALEFASYTPAVRKGARVRQLVQQPFSFTATHARLSGQ
jgi:TonB family protein